MAPGRRWAYTRGLVREDNLHPADWNLRLLERCGVPAARSEMSFPCPPTPWRPREVFLRSTPCIPAGPPWSFSRSPVRAQKNWPLENFLAVARHWRDLGVQVIFVGGPADHARLEPARAEKFCVAAGLPLLVSAGLVQLAALTLGGDTGLGPSRRGTGLPRGDADDAQPAPARACRSSIPTGPSRRRGRATSTRSPVEQVLAETGKVLQPTIQSTKV